MNGIINVYKEKDFTSHDVVAKLRGILKQKKIGHTGTLDPQAEGVLPVCVGNATKLCDLLTDKTKEYEAVLRLGVTTDTQDMTGTILSESAVEITEEKLKEIIMSFLGKSEQIPPMYSALKVGGKKLYELAREGKEVERKPRPIEIFKLEITEINLPLVRMVVGCSKGTYIRTLCHDIGQMAGCGAAMESLLRSRVDRFTKEEALTLGEIEKIRDEGGLDKIIMPVDAFFDFYPKVMINGEYRKVIDNGNPFMSRMIGACAENGSSPWLTDAQEEKKNEAVKNLKAENIKVLVYNEDEIFYGLYEYSQEKHCFVPYKMFLDRELLKD